MVEHFTHSTSASGSPLTNASLAACCGTIERLTNQVPVLEIEPVQLVASLLCIHHVLVDNEGGALRIIGKPLAYLAV